MEQNELYKLVKDFREGRRYRILGYRVLNDDEKYDTKIYSNEFINSKIEKENYVVIEKII